MARFSTVSKTAVSSGPSSVDPALVQACAEQLQALTADQAAVVELEETDDPKAYRKAFQAAADQLGITIRLQKKRGSEEVFYVRALSESEAVLFQAAQEAAAEKRKATVVARNKVANGKKSASKKAPAA